MIFFIPFLIGLAITILLLILFFGWASTFGWAALILVVFPIGYFLLPLIIGTLIGLVRLFRANYANKTKKVIILIFGFLVIVICVIQIIGSFRFSHDITQKARNDVRKVDSSALAGAIAIYYQRNHKLPPQITTQLQNISKSGADLCSVLVPLYIVSLPNDPMQGNGGYVSKAECSSNYDTGYLIERNQSGDQFTIIAPKAEGVKISTNSGQLKPS